MTLTVGHPTNACFFKWSTVHLGLLFSKHVGDNGCLQGYSSTLT